MSAFTSEREGSSRVGKSRGRTMNYLRNQRQRLQSSRTRLFEEQQRREVMELTLAGHCKHCTKTFKIHIRRLIGMMSGPSCSRA